MVGECNVYEAFLYEFILFPPFRHFYLGKDSVKDNLEHIQPFLRT